MSALGRRKDGARRPYRVAGSRPRSEEPEGGPERPARAAAIHTAQGSYRGNGPVGCGAPGQFPAEGAHAPSVSLETDFPVAAPVAPFENGRARWMRAVLHAAAWRGA